MNPAERSAQFGNRVKTAWIRWFSLHSPVIASSNFNDEEDADRTDDDSFPLLRRRPRGIPCCAAWPPWLNNASCMIPRILLPGIAFLALAVFGCAGYRTAVHPPCFKSPQAALQALASLAPESQAFISTARIEIRHHGDRYPLKAAVMMKRPDLLRVESIPLMGPPDLYLSVAAGELRVFLPEKNAFYTGPATPRNISRFLPVFIPAGEMVSLMMGFPPDDPEPVQSSNGECENGLYRIDQFREGRKVRSLWIDSNNGRLVRFRKLNGQGTALYTAEFKEYSRVGDDFLPLHVAIRIEETAALSIRYTDMKGYETDPGSFPLQIPQGMIPIALDP